MGTMQKTGTLKIDAIAFVIIFVIVSFIMFSIVIASSKTIHVGPVIVATILEALLFTGLTATLAYEYSKLKHQGEPIPDSNLQCEVLYLVGSTVDWAVVKLTQVDNLTEGIVSMKAGDFNAIKALLDREEHRALTLVRRADHKGLEEKWYKATLLNDENTATLRKNSGVISVKDSTIFISTYGNLYHLQPLSDFWLPQDRPASKTDTAAHSQTADDVFAQAGA